LEPRILLDAAPWAIADTAHSPVADQVPDPVSSLVQIPGGTFIMGDVNDTFSNPHHANDQIPLHPVELDGFSMGRTEIKSTWYRDFLNAEIRTGGIQVVDNSYVVRTGTDIIYCDVYDPESNTKSLFIWDGSQFSIHDNMVDHPANTIRWEGAVAYCNWLSRMNGYDEVYDLDTWEIDYTKSGIRLPTEAEWEYAARGGDNYREFSWGSHENDNGTYGNFGNTSDPYEVGDDLPNSTPVGFYNGQYHLKEDFDWPGAATGYQTSDNSNGYGLQDMSGNAFEWVNDWYGKNYYSELYSEYGESPVPNPEGPSKENASIMPDGTPWRSLRGGSWDEKSDRYGHLATRKSGYWRGELDPTYPYFHFGFRIVLDENGSDTSSTVIDNTDTNTVGLLYYDQSKASTDGYVLYAPKESTTTYLINKSGQVLKTWESKTGPGQKAIITPDGYFYRAGNAKGDVPTIIARAQAGTFEKQTWDGELLWEFEYVKDDAISHHDYTVMPNGNILAMVVEKKSYEEGIEAGFLPDFLTPEGISVESVLEFAPAGTPDADGVIRGYEIVWEWHLWDHLVSLDQASEHPELYRIYGPGDKLNWNHGNGIDYNAELNQIALSFRNGDEIVVIEYTGNLGNGTEIARGHDGGAYGKGGDFLYRWGNTAQYGRGDVHLSYSQHAVHWIPEGYPGAGNFLIFNNGSQQRPYSTVSEIASQWDDATQSYPDISSSDAHWGPDTLVWEWNVDNDYDIYSDDSSGAQRLRNGNTLIAFGIYGILMEVTPDREIVWQYKCPVTKDGPLWYNADIETTSDGSLGRVFKVKEYEPDYSGFEGQDLAPIADSIELYGDISLTTHTVAENQPAETVVGTFSTVDPESQDIFTYALVSGEGAEDNAAFRISEDQLVTATLLDFELKSVFQIRVRSTDPGGVSIEEAFTINVTNANDAPYVATAIPNQTARANGRFRFRLPADTFADQDAGQTFSYAAEQPDGSPLPDWLAFNAKKMKFSGRPLVHDVGQFSVRVTATDSGTPALAASAEFSITVDPHPYPRQNADQPEDVDGNGPVTPLDVLTLVNWINGKGAGPVPPPSPDPADSTLFLDVNGDSLVSPMDVLAVVNCINNDFSFGSEPPEGEANSDARHVCVVPDATRAVQPAEGEGVPATASSSATENERRGTADIGRRRHPVVDEAFGRDEWLGLSTDLEGLLGTLADDQLT